jgi:hypothetical protein
MKYLILLISLNCFADSECVDREFNDRIEEVGEVTGEEYSEMVDFCSLNDNYEALDEVAI